ncbi:hypothetical protein HQQ80_04460 [Microbacteriaceae bacterium VKM Ac-2855]|nr:hypothetical protein [Microbacteriaceae bacterium VKM Ac-2855]
MAENDNAAVLREILAALDEPGGIHPGLADSVRARVRETLDTEEAPAPRLEDRNRMPTLGVPLAAINGAPDDDPPLPPAAL